MRPRAIHSVPGLDAAATPFERFEQFARRIIAVPRSEVEKEIKEPVEFQREKNANDGGRRIRKKVP